jgi:hypothetical protein
VDVFGVRAVEHWRQQRRAYAAAPQDRVDADENEIAVRRVWMQRRQPLSPPATGGAGLRILTGQRGSS